MSGVFLLSGNRKVGIPLALDARDRRFESCFPDQQEVSEWLKLLVSETSDGTKALSSVGSNPTFLTNRPKRYTKL